MEEGGGGEVEETSQERSSEGNQVSEYSPSKGLDERGGVDSEILIAINPRKWEIHTPPAGLNAEDGNMLKRLGSSSKTALFPRIEAEVICH